MACRVRGEACARLIHEVVEALFDDRVHMRREEHLERAREEGLARGEVEVVYHALLLLRQPRAHVLEVRRHVQRLQLHPRLRGKKVLGGGQQGLLKELDVHAKIVEHAQQRREEHALHLR